jgi:hypothetical protein
MERVSRASRRHQVARDAIRAQHERRTDADSSAHGASVAESIEVRT